MEVPGKRESELCDICESDPANGFCNDCKEYMCQRCFLNHRAAKPCRHHVLSPLDIASDLISRKTHEEKCKVHTTENIRYYCRRHKVVGCGDCIVSNHVGCKAEIIKDLAMNFEESKEFSEFLRRMDKCVAENMENTINVERNIKQNKEFIDNALDEIRKFRKEINDYMDQAEKVIITKANKHYKNNDFMFSHLQQTIAEVSKEIDDIREQVDTRAHHGENLFIRVVECKRRQALVQQTVAEIKSRNTTIKYTFEPEQKLKDILKSNIRFGTIQFINDEEQATCEKITIKTEPSAEPSHTLKQPHAAENKLFPKDPCSAGFDVGKRVKWNGVLDSAKWNIGTGVGSIVSVDPKGWVHVSWDLGFKTREKAGAGGDYWVQLL